MENRFEEKCKREERLSKNRFFLTHFLILPNIEKLSLHKIFHRNKQIVALINLWKTGSKKNAKEGRG